MVLSHIGHTVNSNWQQVKITLFKFDFSMIHMLYLTLKNYPINVFFSEGKLIKLNLFYDVRSKLHYHTHYVTLIHL